MLTLLAEPVALEKDTISNVDVLYELKRMSCVPLYPMCEGIFYTYFVFTSGSPVPEGLFY